MDKPERISPWQETLTRATREHTERENRRLAEIGRLPPVFKVAFPGNLKMPLSEPVRTSEELEAIDKFIRSLDTGRKVR